MAEGARLPWPSRAEFARLMEGVEKASKEAHERYGETADVHLVWALCAVDYGSFEVFCVSETMELLLEQLPGYEFKQVAGDGLRWVSKPSPRKPGDKHDTWYPSYRILLLPMLMPKPKPKE